MGSPLNALIRTEDTLHILAQQLIDSQEGLKKTGEELRAEEHKRLFLAESLKRAEFRGEIESILHREGERDLNIRGTAEGAVVRAWTGLRSMLGASDSALLELAQEGEQGLSNAYASALEKDLPLPVRQTLVTQAAAVQQFLDTIAQALGSGESAG